MNTNFNLSFGNPKSDTCQTCDRLQNIINAENDIELKSTLIDEKRMHVGIATTFYSDFNNLSKESRINESIEVLSFDFQQNRPHIPCGDVFYKRQLWSYNF